MPKVDIKHFKRISSDQHKTVLQHPDGHHLVIAHEHLSPKMRAEVAAIKEAPSQKMFKGEEVKEPSVLSQDSGEFAPASGMQGSLVPTEEQAGILSQPQSEPIMSQQPQAPQGDQPTIAPKINLSNNPNDPWGTQGMVDQLTRGIENQRQGITDAATAQGAQAKEESQAIKQGLDQQQALQQHYEQANQQIEGERQGFMNDLKNSHIDPDQYLTNMSGGQRVGTAIGLILGGIGGGLTGQENPAMKFLQNQIDRNIEGQKSNVGIKNNLLEANRQHFQDEKSATDMTRVMMNDMLSHKIQLAAANSTDPLVKARALQARGQLDQQTYQIAGQLKMRQAALNGMKSGQIDPSIGVRFIVPENQQPAAYKEVQQAQSMMKGRDNLLSGFDFVTKNNTLGNRVMHPFNSSSQIDAAWDPGIAQLTKDSEGRITPQDLPLINSFKPKMSDSAQVTRFKKQKFENFIQQKMTFPVLDSYGINPTKNNMGNSGQQFNFTPRGQ
jgi:hypothetical protein